jgi:hypothetical protein
MRSSHRTVKKAVKMMKIVGPFYEELSLRLINGSRRSEERHDDIIAATSTGEILMEIKASDNNHQIRLPTTQFERQHGSVGWELSRLCHGIFRYGNREGKQNSNGTRATLLSKCKTEEQAWNVLAQNTQVFYILDSKLTKAIAEKNGVQRNLFLDSKEEGFVVTNSILSGLRNGQSRTTLQLLGLRPSDWEIEHKKVILPFKREQGDLLGFTTELAIVEIYPRRNVPVIERIMS